MTRAGCTKKDTGISGPRGDGFGVLKNGRRGISERRDKKNVEFPVDGLDASPKEILKALESKINKH